ncbi:hypothetical protein BC830DRAFT_1170383 [Chytriomyces sp. MP71]|nr:hypothetical protein BC830DRAFT_1170383 [Chytriomyces sp. MP71]
MATFVKVSQAADGRITNTLSLDSKYLASFTSGSPVLASFVVNNLPLCTATGSLPVRLNDNCPFGMLTFNSRCFSISCTGPVPVGLTSGLYEVGASFSVGRSTGTTSSLPTLLMASSAAASSSTASTAVLSSAVSSSVKASSISSILPSSPPTSTTAETTDRITASNGVQNSTVLSSATGSAQQSDNGSSGPSPVAIGVGASIGAIVLAGIATIVYCNYTGRVRRDRRKQTTDVLAAEVYHPPQRSLPPKEFATPSPPKGNKPATAWNSAQPIGLTVLERKEEAPLPEVPRSRSLNESSPPNIAPIPEAGGTPMQQSQAVYVPPIGYPTGIPQQHHMTAEQYAMYAAPFQHQQQQRHQMSTDQYAAYISQYQQHQSAYAYPTAAAGQQQYPGYYDERGQYRYYNQGQKVSQPPAQQDGSALQRD